MKALILASVIVSVYRFSIATQSLRTTANDNYGKCEACGHFDNLLVPKNTSDLIHCPSDDCTTPDGLRGKCVDLHSCPDILDTLEGCRSKAALKYYEQSRCDGPAEYSVCCGVPHRPGLCYLTSHPPDPSTACCGVNAMDTLDTVSASDVRYGHPWLAIIMYAKGEEYLLLCGGVLISGRYVFTAGHCITGPMLKKGTPVSVRLGPTNCEDTNDADCYDGVDYLPIQKYTSHPDYRPHTNPKQKDVGLVRLTRIVKFTDYIRPICLPSYNIEEAVMTHIHSLNVPIILMPDLWKPDSNQTSSFVENPAAAIVGRNKKWHELIGMVTMRTTACGEKKLDGTYSNAYLFLDWIRSQIAADDDEEY